MEISDIQFEQLVNESWKKIPEKFRNELGNVSVMIEMEPTPYQVRKVKARGTLLGLYEGVPNTAWGQAIMGTQPSKITLFQRSIIRYSRDIKSLKNLILEVLMHEVAHYFGYNEDDMCVMDKKLKKRLAEEGDFPNNFKD